MVKVINAAWEMPEEKGSMESFTKGKLLVSRTEGESPCPDHYRVESVVGQCLTARHRGNKDLGTRSSCNQILFGT